MSAWPRLIPACSSSSRWHCADMAVAESRCCPSTTPAPAALLSQRSRRSVSVARRVLNPTSVDAAARSGRLAMRDRPPRHRRSVHPAPTDRKRHGGREGRLTIVTRCAVHDCDTRRAVVQWRAPPAEPRDRRPARSGHVRSIGGRPHRHAPQRSCPTARRSAARSPAHALTPPSSLRAA
jgi:hypothetical protein